MTDFDTYITEAFELVKQPVLHRLVAQLGPQLADLQGLVLHAVPAAGRGGGGPGGLERHPQRHIF
ncbi:hypothetical protein AWY89_10950 [Pasteurella multocida subsp. multocida]|nr:hypothetical protein AWY89_10950 [Pasteurella multocida subsp. multocida]